MTSNRDVEGWPPLFVDPVLASGRVNSRRSFGGSALKSVPTTVERPGAISTVAEIVEAVTERLLGQSRTQLPKETRPLKLSIAGLGALVVATCGWGYAQVTTPQEAQRHQWTIEAKQAERDDAMAAHPDVPRLDPKAIEGMNARLSALEARIAAIKSALDALAEDGAAAVPRRARPPRH